MVITLTPDIEQALAEQAQQQGTTPEALALERLRREFVQSDNGGTRDAASPTLADLLGDSIGVLDSAGLVPGGAARSTDAGQR